MQCSMHTKSLQNATCRCSSVLRGTAGPAAGPCDDPGQHALQTPLAPREAWAQSLHWKRLPACCSGHAVFLARAGLQQHLPGEWRGRAACRQACCQHLPLCSRQAGFAKMGQAAESTAASTSRHHVAMQASTSLLPLILCKSICHSHICLLCRRANLPQATHLSPGGAWPTL